MNCPHCGAPNPDAAVYCQYCGSSISAPSGTPLPSSTTSAPAPPPIDWSQSGYGAPPAPRRRRLGRTVLIVLVVFVVLILLVSVVSFLLLPAPASVTVTQLYFTSVDNACGVDGATSDGFNASTSQAISLSFYITGNNTTSGTSACRIQTVSTPTAGFVIAGADTPLYVAANQTGTLSFNVDTPNSGYSGILTIVVT